MQDGKGKLTIYKRPSQIGVIANRVIKHDGRVAKIIYYRLSDFGIHPPYKESDLVEAGVRTFKYDANGRAYRSETSGLTSVMAVEETQWKEDGSPRSISWSGRNGRVSHRNLYRNGRRVTELHYNADGMVAGIRGEVLQDQDLAGGWGKTVDDVACAVLPSAARAPFAPMGLWITARNRGKADRKIVTIGKTSPEFLVAVRRADGTLVQQDPQYVKQQFDRRQRGNINRNDVAQILWAGKAELVAWGRPLSHWYADLPPGKYKVTVTCRSGDKFNLVSNAAAFEILPAQAASAPTSQPAQSVSDTRTQAEHVEMGKIEKTAQKAANELLSVEDFQLMRKLPAQWRKLPEKTQKELIVVLLEKMESLRPRKLVNYADMAVKSRVIAKKMAFHGHGLFLDQDVFITGGRCAWAIEALLECILPPITEELKPDGLRESVKAARYAVIRCMRLPRSPTTPPAP